MKIFFLVPYPLKESPSQRFRFEQYFEALTKAGHTYAIQTFLDSHNWHLFFKSGFIIKKLFSLAKGFLKRWLALLKTSKYDFVFVHREVAPIGPPIFEWIISRILKKKIIYDFDDAIWMTDRLGEGVFFRFFKWRRKVSSICSWSYKVSCGNHYLKDYALQFNSFAFYNPSTLDCVGHHNPTFYKPTKSAGEIVIGWTGSHSTLKYLTTIQPVIERLQNQFSFISFLVIADQLPTITLQKMTFIKWNPETEVADLLKIDIGIMPLPDDEWAKGKCGFKALQYMSLEIPAVVSPVGVNSSIINHGVNGYLAFTDKDWFNYLSALIIDQNLRNNIGKLGRETVIKNYSVSSNTANFLSLFE